MFAPLCLSPPFFSCLDNYDISYSFLAVSPSVRLIIFSDHPVICYEEYNYRSSLLCTILIPHPYTVQFFSVSFPLNYETKFQRNIEQWPNNSLHILSRRSYRIYKRGMRSLRFIILSASVSINYN
jgi:hypothetical protein